MVDKLIEVSLFGACSVRSVRRNGFEIGGTKQRALFALLATAPFGRRTRSYVQEMLWGTACYDTGRQSLRRALADIKQIMGEAYSELLTSTNSDLTLDLRKVSYVGQPGHGEFLEGLDVREDGFIGWVKSIRQNPGQIHSLYSLGVQTPQRPVVPLVAILPFRAVSGNVDDLALGDWLAEEACRSLSRSNLVSVISHLSSRQLAQQMIDVSAVRNQLRAHFFVAGSLRRFSEKIVLDADFICTDSGRILWTRQFSAPVSTFIENASDGVSLIVRAVGQSVADDALHHAAGRPLVEIATHRLLIAGVSLMHGTNRADFIRSRDLLEEAVRRAPRSAEAHSWLSKWHILSVFNGRSENPAQDTHLAIDYSARALDISPNEAFCLTIDGFAQNNLLRRLDVAESRFEAALESNPNDSLSWLLKGALHSFRDEGDKAVEAASRARNLSPIDPFGYFYDALLAGAYLSNGACEQALELANRSLSVNDRHLSTLRIKLVALYLLGRNDEARDCARALLKFQPDFTIKAYMRQHPSADYHIGRRIAEAFRATGIPD